MGNYCDAVDSKLEELYELDDLNNSNSTVCNSHDGINNSLDPVSYSNFTEATQKIFRYRNPKRKLNTIIEDKYEDICSPFLKKI